MKNKILFIFAIAIPIFLLDQYIKQIFVDGFVWHSKCISLILAYNDGVAFSMLSSLKEYLKYIQIALMLFLAIYILREKELLFKHTLSVALIFGGGVSNIFDRFIHTKGVVDYVYWHCGFDFAIFNFADVVINFAVFLILIKYLLSLRKKA